MTTKNSPYTDATYIDAEVEALRLRLHRLELEHRLADAERSVSESASGPHQGRGPGIPGLRGILCEVSRLEQQVSDEVSASLELHRADADAPELGLDRLCREHEAGTLMDANVELSCKAFGIIFNDPEALSEVSEDAGE